MGVPPEIREEATGPGDSAGGGKTTATITTTGARDDNNKTATKTTTQIVLEIKCGPTVPASYNSL